MVYFCTITYRFLVSLDVQEDIVACLLEVLLDVIAPKAEVAHQGYVEARV